MQFLRLTYYVTVPEVQRCWSRFLLLQPDQAGNLPRTRFLRTDSIFGQKLLKQIPVTDDDQITFQTYCNAVSWLSKSSLEIKLKGLYQTLAPGVMDQQVLRDLLHDLYLKQSHSVTEELSAAFLRDVDVNKRGYISEDIFVAWVQSLPQETVKSILNFPLIPSNLSFSEPLTSNPNVAANIQDEGGLGDVQLFRVATEVITRKRNWKLLADRLGVLDTDGLHSEQDPLEAKHQILKMLQLWHRTCRQDPLPVLQAALQESGNVDICNEVFSLSF